MSKIKLLIKVFASPKRLKTLLSFNDKGYLDEIGWFNAYDNKSPVDGEGNPIPWVTYSFIDFIKERLKKAIIFFFFSNHSKLNHIINKFLVTTLNSFSNCFFLYVEE